MSKILRINILRPFREFFEREAIDNLRAARYYKGDMPANSYSYAAGNLCEAMARLNFAIAKA